VKKNDIKKVLELLYNAYPDAECELNYNTAFQLLVSTILSAQATDKKVNEVTERVFKKYSTVYDFAGLTQEELEIEIKEIGLYKNKSKNILSMSKTLINEYNGEVPPDRDELMKLAGVGRKTANVVVSNVFNIPAIAVDTHVFRVSNRIGFARSSTVEKTEIELMDNIPKEQWTKAHHTLIFHGRRTCIARNPKCESCTVKDYCNFYIEKSRA
jgi:endonuclease-3